MNELQKFYDELQCDVINESLGGETDSGDFKENSFTRIVILDLAAAGVLETPLVCYCEPSSAAAGAMKVNGYSFPEDDTCLDLVVSAYFADETPHRLKGSDLDRSLNMGLRFFRSAVNGLHERLDSGTEQYAMAKEIFDRQGTLDRVRIFLVTNGLAVQRKALERREKEGQWNVSYEIWDLERVRRFRSSGATHEPVQIELTPDERIRCARVPTDGRSYATCVAILPGKMLHDWYDEYGSRLLELNVRSYLQARGKINSGILETIIKEPGRFLSYNNGITIVAEEVTFADDGEHIVGIRGLQIVNGGQTTASIHRAHKENKADLRDVHVQAKITIVPADVFETVVPDISRYSNTQNKVTEIDLGANHIFHVGVERVALATWAPGEQTMWFYERARGGYQTMRSRDGTTRSARDKFDSKFPATQRISKEDLARYCNTWNGFAPIVNKGGQKNFVKFMESLPKLEKGWEPSREEFRDMVAKAIFFRSAQDIARKLKLSAFGINIVIYTVALLAEKTARRINLQSIWENQGLCDALVDVLTDWLQRVAAILKSSAAHRNPGEWFKQEACWKQLKEYAAEWQIPPELSARLVTATTIDGDIPDSVHNAIAECLRVDAATWFDIQVWAGKSGALKSWQAGIANTLSGYAAGGWVRKPSVKQATHAMKILEIFRNAAGSA